MKKREKTTSWSLTLSGILAMTAGHALNLSISKMLDLVACDQLCVSS